MKSSLVFRSVRLFDGLDMHDGVDVSVTEGRVEDIGSRLHAGDGTEVIDGEGRTLMPGLIDAHTHTWGPALRQAVVFGVTTELDMFTAWRYAAAMRVEQAAGDVTDRADLYSA